MNDATREAITKRIERLERELDEDRDSIAQTESWLETLRIVKATREDELAQLRHSLAMEPA